MLKNLFVVALRNINRNRITSAINIVGLGLGIGIFIIIMLFIKTEYQYDKFIADSDRIFRVELGDWALMAPGLANKAKEICSEVEESVSIELFTITNEIVKVGDNSVKLNNYYPVSKSFFKIFNFNILHGEKLNPLEEPYSLVITKSEAQRLFGKENPVGETVLFFDKYLFTVTAVMENPELFHIPVNGLLPIEFTYELFQQPNRGEMLLGNQNNPTYLKLRSENDREAVATKLSEVVTEYVKGKRKIDFFLRPVSEIYFNGAIPFEGKVRHGNIRFIRVMIIVAFLIIILACINYVNLSTAHASNRAKEIGVRKVSGASRWSIAIQFISESVITTVVALLIAILFAEVTSPIFSRLIEKNIDTMFFSDPYIIFLCLAGALAVGVISGLYPALYLSSFNPSKVLKGEVSKGVRGQIFRKSLIVFQFAVSTGLIISTLVIYSQLKHFTSYDVGFDKDQVITIEIPRKKTHEYQTFRNLILDIPGVKGISQSNSKPGNIQWQEGWVDEHGQSHNFSLIPVDPDYIDVLGLQLVEGRNIEWDRPGEIDQAYIVNETLVNKMGLVDPIGATIPGYGNRIIVGVIKDFHFNSLHSTIGPLALNQRTRAFNTYNIKIDVSEIQSTLVQISKIWSEHAIDAPFEYTFLNESFENLYRSELRMGLLFGYFATIAIIIGCMGLFGLSAFMLQARIKEMGIRKVLGASSFKIIGIMGREFAILILIANAIAWPIAYFAMNSWLEGFPFRTHLSIVFFIVALLISLIIALLTVAYHSWKTARANPVESLKHE
jgi:putative ABC transport system permease protein